MNLGVPQLVKESADDICYKHEGYLCGILFLRSAPDENTVGIFKSLSEKYSNKKDRGADVKFMWVDLNTDLGYFESFEGVKEAGLSDMMGKLVWMKLVILLIKLLEAMGSLLISKEDFRN